MQRRFGIIGPWTQFGQLTLIDVFPYPMPPETTRKRAEPARKLTADLGLKVLDSVGPFLALLSRVNDKAHDPSPASLSCWMDHVSASAVDATGNGLSLMETACRGPQCRTQEGRIATGQPGPSGAT
jgi:hypothetical protein